MTVFGIGTPEIILILLVLILLFGADRIIEMGTGLGRAYKKISDIGAEVNQQVSDVRRAVDAAVDAREITNPLADAMHDVKGIRTDLEETARMASEREGVSTQPIGGQVRPVAQPDKAHEGQP